MDVKIGGNTLGDRTQSERRRRAYDAGTMVEETCLVATTTRVEKGRHMGMPPEGNDNKRMGSRENLVTAVIAASVVVGARGEGYIHMRSLMARFAAPV